MAFGESAKEDRGYLSSERARLSVARPPILHAVHAPAHVMVRVDVADSTASCRASNGMMMRKMTGYCADGSSLDATTR